MHYVVVVILFPSNWRRQRETERDRETERERSLSSASASFIIDLDSRCCRRNNIRSWRFVGVSIISPVGKECRPSFWYEFGFFWRFFLLWQLLGFDVELMPEQA